MTDQASARMNLPYLAAGQLQKHVTLNEALTRLDVLVQTAVISRTVVEQPSDPVDGALYILPVDATGPDWAWRPSNTLVRAELGAWQAVSMPEGLLVAVLDEPALVILRAGAWVSVWPVEAEPVRAMQNLTRLGLNTEADANNPFAARVNKALWTAAETGSGGDGDLRFTFNKQGASDVLSLLFQSGWSGRAELGLVGDDDIRLKVSPDGGAWHDAFAVDRSSGRVWFQQGAGRLETTVLTSNATWAPPAWARWVEAVCVGGGGGGGAGSVAPSGTAKLGGGGGAAGAVVSIRLDASALSSGVVAVVGLGGAGGAANAQSGASGTASSLTLNGQQLLQAPGGAGGTGLGQGGEGSTLSNAGGTSSILTEASAGESTRCPNGAGGCGAGGGISASSQVLPASAGGDGAVLYVWAAGGQAGTATGSIGTDAVSSLSWAGGGGGGGGGATSGSGHSGAAGGRFGAGGGGGGAAVTTAGQGGAGASGVIWLTAIG